MSVRRFPCLADGVSSIRCELCNVVKTTPASISRRQQPCRVLVSLAPAARANKVDSTFFAMPNQLSKSKRRQSLAEHEAVLAALADIARRENTTVMALLRQATRALVKRKASDPKQAGHLRELIWQRAPRMPSHFKTPAQVARFKRAQREFDQVLLDLELASPRALRFPCYGLDALRVVVSHAHRRSE